MEAEFCVEALEEAMAKHGKPNVFNTDQGSQFSSEIFTPVLIDNAIAISMDAIRYALTRIKRLQSYLDNGFLEIDNNSAERSMRPIPLGRKNYLFMGSEGGGKSAAIAYTLIETAKLNGVDPQAWLSDIIGRIADHKITRLDELLPWRYAALAA